jgi:dTDP-4-dehydrorhamnose 3,5-epimerase
MAYETRALPVVVLFTPKEFGDESGFFFVSFRERVFGDATDLDYRFVHDNHSKSVKVVLRCLHYQLPPHAHGMLARVIQATVFDVALDIRKSSPNFGKWVNVMLSAENKHQLWIPTSFAHGFVTLTDTADFLQNHRLVCATV